MPNRIVAFFRALGRSPLHAVLLGVSGGWGAWQGFSAAGGEWDSPLALVLFAVVASGHGLMRLPLAAAGSKFPAWLLLVGGIALMGYARVADWPGLRQAALFLGVAGAVVVIRGWRTLPPVLLPLALDYLVLPFQESLTLLLSYPLRLISTELAVGVLQGGGMEIEAQLTTIRLGGSSIAITDACSGVAQLSVLFFFAYLLMLAHPEVGRGGRWLWGLLVLPIVVVANTVRLLLTIGLFWRFGELAFRNSVHLALGYFFVALALALLWGSGKWIVFLRELKHADSSD